MSDELERCRSTGDVLERCMSIESTELRCSLGTELRCTSIEDVLERSMSDELERCRLTDDELEPCDVVGDAGGGTGGSTIFCGPNADGIACAVAASGASDDGGEVGGGGTGGSTIFCGPKAEGTACDVTGAGCALTKAAGDKVSTRMERNRSFTLLISPAPPPLVPMK